MPPISSHAFKAPPPLIPIRRGVAAAPPSRAILRPVPTKKLLARQEPEPAATTDRSEVQGCRPVFHYVPGSGHVLNVFDSYLCHFSNENNQGLDALDACTKQKLGSLQLWLNLDRPSPKQSPRLEATNLRQRIDTEAPERHLSKVQEYLAQRLAEVGRPKRAYVINKDHPRWRRSRMPRDTGTERAQKKDLGLRKAY